MGNARVVNTCEQAASDRAADLHGLYYENHT